MPNNPKSIRSSRRLEAQYMRYLKLKVLDPLFRDLRDGLAQVAALDQAYRAIQHAAQRSAAHSIPPAEVRSHFEKVNTYHRQRLFKTFRVALGVDVLPLLHEAPVRALLSDVVNTNVDLIKTIPPRMHDSLKARFEREFLTAPFDEQRLSGLLRREYGSTGYNLRRLSRDQTQKTVNGLTQIRHRQLGVEGYIWRTSEDERVRPTHVVNNGAYWRWDDPPQTTGHPGTDVQCRCTAEPALRKVDRDRIRKTARTATTPVAPPTVTPSVASPFPAEGVARRSMLKRHEQKLERDSADYLQNRIAAAQRNALTAYTLGPDRLNVPLRSGMRIPPEVARDVARVKKVIADSPVVSPPLVYRGVSYSIGRPKVGDVLTLDGFPSTSVDPSVAAKFGYEVLEIRPKHGVYIKPISGYKAENEWLLDAGRRYRVVGIDKASVGATDKKKRPIIQLEEL